MIQNPTHRYPQDGFFVVKKLILPAVVLAVSVVLLTGTAAGWSGYQNGNTNTGYTSDPGPVKEPRTNWTRDIRGTAGSSVVISDSTAYFGTFSGDYITKVVEFTDQGQREDMGSGRVYALDTGTGETLWSASTNGSVWSSPAVHNGTVYLGSVSGNLYAIDAGTGGIDWKVDLGPPVLSSPLVSDGSVYLATRTKNSHKLSRKSYPFYSLNASTGEINWRKELEEGTMGSAAVGGGKVYIGSINGTLFGINSSDGSTAWEFSTENFNYTDPNARFGGIESSPTVYDGTVYIGSYPGEVYAVNSTTGKEVWKYQTESAIASSPAVRNGTVYIGDYSSRVYAIEAKTGDVVWETSVQGRISKSSPAVTNESVYVGSAGIPKGWMYSLDIYSGEVAWSHKTGGWVLSSPAIVNKNLYFTSLGKIHKVQGE
jgi:outer membrane protein assembly factor BamB